MDESSAEQPGTRWLDADQQASWRAYLSASQLIFDVIERQLQADSGMSHADYELLVRLSEAPGRSLRMSELAESTLFSRSRLSHAVARLELQGWVERTAHAEDRRGTDATLTDRGFDVLAGAAAGHVEAVRAALIDTLSAAQLAGLRESSEAVVAALGAGRSLSR